MERANLFKKKTIFGSKEARRQRALEVKKERTDKRTQQFNQARAVSNIQEDVGAGADANLDRRKRLELWQAQKNLKKKVEAAKKKPAFVVGVTRHKIYSPTSADPPKPHCHGKKNLPKKPSPIKKITRATAKRLAAKTAGTPLSCKFKSLVSENYVFKPPPGIEPILMQNKSFTKKDLASKISTLISSFKANGDENVKNLDDIPKIDDGVNKSLVKESKDVNIAPELNTDDKQNDFKESEALSAYIEPKTFNTKNQCEFIGGNTDEIPDGTKDLGGKSEEPNGKIEKSPVKKPKRSRRAVKPKTETNQSDYKSDEPQLSGPEILTTPKNNKIDNSEDDIPILAAISPYIVTGRGKSARKEQRDRLLNGSFGDDVNTARYYKHMLQLETEKLLALCEKWKQIQEETTGEGCSIIQQAVGQSELLITKKFQRFSRLVDDCESNNQELLVKSDDLRGFWEMMEPEIKNCHDRFANVEKLKEKNWVEDEEEVPAPTEVKKKGKRVVKPKVQGRSNMKAFIEAARKKKLQDEAQAEKTPEGRVLRSQVAKTPEIQLDSSINYINSHQTPGKSILKKNSNTKDLNKSMTKVNFSIQKESTGVDEAIKKLKNDEEPEKPKSEATERLINKLFKKTGGLSNIGRVNVRAAKAQRMNETKSPAKTPKRKSTNNLEEKENAVTPRRRSSRRSTRLNISDECTAC